MLQVLPPEEFLASDIPMLDVRSPGEFLRGHIPGAHCLPLFTDEERAAVGTIYKQQGRDAAVLEGLRHTGPKLAGMVEQAQHIAPGRHVRVYCWRGGERSGSVGWLLSKAGFQVTVLAGGYKSFRDHVLASFDPPLDVRVIGGYTGSGKTFLLQELRHRGHQVIDLESLAVHKGSAFGGLGLGAQPTTEHFENLLWGTLKDLDPNRPVWVEDESLMIGKVRLPLEFHGLMRKVPVVFIEIPRQTRATQLAREYGHCDPAQLAAAIQRISRRLGPQHAKAALEALEQGDMEQVALITLQYYDKAYLRGLAERDPAHVMRITMDQIDPAALAERLEQHVTTIG